jgi:hypothetical protein
LEENGGWRRDGMEVEVEVEDLAVWLGFDGEMAMGGRPLRHIGAYNTLLIIYR